MKKVISLFVILFIYEGANAYTMCPDGKYYPDGQCQLNPDGSWRTAPSSTLAPNGRYVPNYSGSPQPSQAQDLYNMTNSFDPYGAFRQGGMAKDKYDLEEEQLKLQMLEIQRRKRQLQQ
jgi:hypothetical protein